MLNQSVINEARQHRLQYGDTYMALLRLRGSKLPRAAEASNFKASGGGIDQWMQLIVDANGSGASKLIVFLNIGESSTDYNQYQFSAHSAAVADPDGIDASPTHTQCTTLGALVKAIDDLTMVNCQRLNGPADLSIDTDDFIDVTATDIQGNFWTSTLYQDVSEVLRFFMRVGNPEPIDRGRMKVFHLSGYCTGATNGTITITEDPDDDVATNAKLLRTFTLAEAQTAYMDHDAARAVTYRGPLLIEVESDDISAADYVLLETQSDW